MKVRSTLGKLSGLIAIIINLVILQPELAFSFEPVFQIRAKHGTPAVGDPVLTLSNALDQENYVRIGAKLGPSLWIGYNSRHGISMIFDF